MGFFTRNLPDWVREVRTSAHACVLCGSMVALDLLDEHAEWHRAHGDATIGDAETDSAADMAPGLD